MSFRRYSCPCCVVVTSRLRQHMTEFHDEWLLDNDVDDYRVEFLKKKFPRETAEIIEKWNQGAILRELNGAEIYSEELCIRLLRKYCASYSSEEVMRRKNKKQSETIGAKLHEYGVKHSKEILQERLAQLDERSELAIVKYIQSGHTLAEFRGTEFVSRFEHLDVIVSFLRKKYSLDETIKHNQAQKLSQRQLGKNNVLRKPGVEQKRLEGWLNMYQNLDEKTKLDWNLRKSIGARERFDDSIRGFTARQRLALLFRGSNNPIHKLSPERRKELSAYANFTQWQKRYVTREQRSSRLQNMILAREQIDVRYGIPQFLEGYRTDSKQELELLQWALVHNVPFSWHARLPKTLKKCDCLFHHRNFELWVEFDGMNRGFDDMKWGGKLSLYRELSLYYVIVAPGFVDSVLSVKLL